jgi:metal-dependent amidase/aminoacylase/carboxypeptidase family protein
MHSANQHARERFDVFGAVCHGGGGSSSTTNEKTTKITRKTTTRLSDVVRGAAGSNTAAGNINIDRDVVPSENVEKAAETVSKVSDDAAAVQASLGNNAQAVFSSLGGALKTGFESLSETSEDVTDTTRAAVSEIGAASRTAQVRQAGGSAAQVRQAAMGVPGAQDSSDGDTILGIQRDHIFVAATVAGLIASSVTIWRAIR